MSRVDFPLSGVHGAHPILWVLLLLRNLDSHLRRLPCVLSGFEGDLFSTLWTKEECATPVAVGGLLCHHVLRTALPHLQPLLHPSEAESHPHMPSPAAVTVLTMMVSSANVLPVCWLIEYVVICNCTCMCCVCMDVWRTGQHQGLFPRCYLPCTFETGSLAWAH